MRMPESILPVASIERCVYCAQAQAAHSQTVPAFQHAAAVESSPFEVDIAAAPAAIAITNAVAKPSLKQRPRKKKLVKVRRRPFRQKASHKCACQ